MKIVIWNRLEPIVTRIVKKKDAILSLKSKCLKVPKREIFVTELFILSDIWVGDLRNEPKNLLCNVLG